MSLIEDLSVARTVLTATMEHRGLVDATDKAVAGCTTALASGRPLMVAGNGGSASDAMHELVGRFLKEPRPELHLPGVQPRGPHGQVQRL